MKFSWIGYREGKQLHRIVLVESKLVQCASLFVTYVFGVMQTQVRQLTCATSVPEVAFHCAGGTLIKLN